MTTALVRPPAAAGSFYPAGARELGRVVDALLANAHPVLPAGTLRALIAPHAGYVFSGQVAASAFAALPSRPPVDRVSLLGPSHYEPLDGAAVSEADRWSTPLGEVSVDVELRLAAMTAGAAVDDTVHRSDHALEVELPFLQRRAGPGLRILPVAIGGHRTQAVGAVVEALARQSLIVLSTDLSHYLDDRAARLCDRRTAKAVVELDDALVGDLDACGAAALRALLAVARRCGWTCTLLELRTSADAFGDTRRVVGYGAFAFTS